MSSRTFTVTKPTRGGKLRDFTGLDAAVLARSGSWVITSPNASWVPKPFLGMEDVQMRADGRYGCVDPFQWPQLFSQKYPWTIAIPSQRHCTGPSAMSWAWYSPRYADFVRQSPASVIGTLNPATQSGLKGLLDIIQGCWDSFRRVHATGDTRERVDSVRSALRKIWDVLSLSVLTWREIVGLVGDYQRVYLELYAIMDYHQLIESRMLLRSGAIDPASPADIRWLGAFTRAPLMAMQLYAAGVPVWLVRLEDEVPQNIIIKDIVNVWEPSDIVIHHYIDPDGQYAWPYDIVFTGNGGEEAMHAKIREITYVAKDYGKDDMTTNSTGRSLEVHRNTRQPVEGWQPYPKSKPVVPPMKRDTWEVAYNTFLPTPLRCVSLVMPSIKKLVESGRMKSRTSGTLTLRFPDPGMLTAVQSADTMRRYFSNWLAIRQAWIQHAIECPSAPLPSSKMWRAFLLSTPADLTSKKDTASAQERANALDFFKTFLPDGASGSTWAGDDTVAFRGNTVKVYKSVLPAQARGITWELHELHFQYDVLALDKVLVPLEWSKAPGAREALWREVFPLDTIGGGWDKPLPTDEKGVFRYTKDQEKFSLLNAFARLLSDWPLAPSYFKTPISSSLGEEKVQGATMQLMGFYIKTFYVQTGRPPICPRHLPVP